MKIFDKLKNALFEEEYVEVEEKPKKEKESKKKIDKKEIRETYFNNPDEDEKPVAKRIVPQDKKIIDTLEEDSLEETDGVSFRDQDLIEAQPEPKITIINEEDLISDEVSSTDNYETINKRRSDNDYEVLEEQYVEEKEEPKLYQNSKKESFYDNYIPHAYGNYEKQREKSKEGFKPSPVISPIYGIVEDSSYEEQPRREVRITTPVNRGKMNLDDIRRKAFGGHVEDKYEESSSQIVNDVNEENTLVDLSDDSKTPEVNSITMGDAMEYFEDLGLEYNNDYIDRSKMIKSEIKDEEKNEFEYNSKPIKINDNTISDEDEDIDDYSALDDRKFTVNEEIEDNINDDVIVTQKQDDEVIENSDSDNLFDLIDSMYE